MIRYVFKTFADGNSVPIKGARVADPQRIGEYIAAAQEKVGSGSEFFELAEQDARSEDHPLHPHLEWDDEVAAKEHRKDQIASIVRLLRTVSDDGEEEHRPAFVSVSVGGLPRKYHQTEDVAGNKELSNAVIAAAERDLLAWETRYKQLTEICAIVRSAREALSRRRSSRTEDRPAA